MGQPRVPLARTFVNQEMLATASNIISSGRWIKGPEADAFGQEWAEWCGALAGVPTSSGSTALIAALRLLNVGPGDEVIVPSLTFIASATCITQVGATPVFVDVEPEYYTMCPKSVKQAITPATKAIIAVHLFGQPIDAEITTFDIPVIEDAAQAHGAEICNHRVGSIGQLATFSFFPSKNLTVGGDGGAILANDEKMAKLLSAAVDHGRSPSNEHQFLSSNFRLSEVQCAIGRIQLKHLDEWGNRRQQIAEIYTESFDENITPRIRDGCKHAWNQYVLKIPNAPAFLSHLDDHNIDATIHYSTPCHLQPLYASHTQHTKGSLPITENICNQLVSIPISPQLSDEEIERVVAAVQSWVTKHPL